MEAIKDPEQPAEEDVVSFGAAVISRPPHPPTPINMLFYFIRSFLII